MDRRGATAESKLSLKSFPGSTGCFSITRRGNVKDQTTWSYSVFCLKAWADELILIFTLMFLMFPPAVRQQMWFLQFMILKFFESTWGLWRTSQVAEDPAVCLQLRLCSQLLYWWIRDYTRILSVDLQDLTSGKVTPEETKHHNRHQQPRDCNFWASRDSSTNPNQSSPMWWCHIQLWSLTNQRGSLQCRLALSLLHGCRNSSVRR